MKDIIIIIAIRTLQPIPICNTHYFYFSLAHLTGISLAVWLFDAFFVVDRYFYVITG